MIVYKPVDGLEPTTTLQYITVDEFNEAMKKVDNNTLKEQIKSIKRQIDDLKDRLDDIRKD